MLLTQCLPVPELGLSFDFFHLQSCVYVTAACHLWVCGICIYFGEWC